MAGWLVVGAAGQLGHDLIDVLTEAGETVVGLDLPDIDITDLASVEAALDRYEPEVVVNAAAYTAVDDAETHEDLAGRINGEGPRNLAQACRDRPDTRLVQVSTDYVFDGTAREPYPEDAPQQPGSAYGRTKLAGEEAVLELHPEGTYVVRTAWLYGVNGANFVKTMLRLEGARDEVAVVDDQVGQPTWSRDLADLILRLVRAEAAPGIYHGTSQGRTSWFGFTQAIFEGVGADPTRVSPTTTDAFPRPAARPAFSVLGHDRLESAGVEPIRPWEEALDEALPLIQQRFLSEQ